MGRCTNFCYSRAATAGVCCAVWSADSKYVIVPRGHGQIRDLWVFPVERGLFRKTLQPVQLTNGPLLYSGAATATSSLRSVFVSVDGSYCLEYGPHGRNPRLRKDSARGGQMQETLSLERCTYSRPLSSWCMGNLAPAETESFLCYLVPPFRFSDCRTHGSRHPVERATMASQTREFPDSKERFDRVNEARKTLATISAFE